MEVVETHPGELLDEGDRQLQQSAVLPQHVHRLQVVDLHQRTLCFLFSLLLHFSFLLVALFPLFLVALFLPLLVVPFLLGFAFHLFAGRESLVDGLMVGVV